ncbi:zinc-dependent metalloprotease [Cryobacterium cheniae]|uniref:Zinc-dependent metalloprotease n=2 Tax=Cryobacterium cheniae TaxID=1259262 RepID=A0A4R8XVH8_9MICO|nr:zinc-dependent metalloprotease [Cryobacterium cheniae]TFC81440.1 zinc-dependent metalloprotease [Cryobacterium cheniae]
MLRDILSGKSSIDPSQLAGAAGLPSDPASISALMNQLQGALRGGGDGSINWDAALSQGQERAAQGQLDVTSTERAALDQAFHIASLWLDEVISVAELTTPPRLMTRKEWVTATMPLWTQLAEPVATSISDSLTRVLTDQAPEELKGMMAGAGQVMRSIGGTLFAMQLGQVVGQLSNEVVSGGDVGIPLLSDQQAALLPQNVAAFGEGLDVPADQVQIYLAVREIAHARLFRHSRWLRLHLISSITDFARGIHIDSGRLEQLAEGFDPANPEELRAAMVDGSLIPPKTEAQLAALGRLETMLALIEGWVDVVTLEATSRLPRADAIAETVKRRRASGGPAESAFATLVGLELRPRRLREAAALWQAVTDAVGNEKRDELWGHPDLLPSSADLDDPQALMARLTSAAAGAEPVLDEVDQALEDLLRDDETDRPHEA